MRKNDPSDTKRKKEKNGPTYLGEGEGGYGREAR